MSFTLEPLSPVEWDAYIEQQPDALLFHTSAWLDLLADVYGCSWEPLGIVANDALVGLLPLQRRRLGPMRLAGSPLMQVIASTPMLGPLFSLALGPLSLAPQDGHGATFLDALEVHLSAERVAHVELAWSGPVEEQPLLKRGYQVERCHAVVLQLAGKSREALWQGLAPSCRRAVRKAEASGVEVVEAETNGFLPEYIGLCQKVYRDAGRAPHLSLRFYAALWERFAATGHVRARLAMMNGRLVAGGIFLEHHGRAWYLSGASSQADEGLRPNNLLQWRTIEDAAARGLALYDMGGATVPGITRFKQSFGATLQPYTRAWRARSSAAHWGRRGYQSLLPVARRVAQRLQR